MTEDASLEAKKAGEASRANKTRVLSLRMTVKDLKMNN
jgi:hypothetical protein